MILSKKGREWYSEAQDRLEAQNPQLIEHPVSISLRLRPPTKRKYDIDNRVKPVLDVLQKAGILVEDDHLHVVELHVTHEEVDKNSPGVFVDISRKV